MSQIYRKAPGTSPAETVILHEPPADWRCTWSMRIDPETGAPYWELKYIHAACAEHSKLAAA